MARRPWRSICWSGWPGCPGSPSHHSGWAFASFGYIVGFVAAAWLVGRLAERGADRRVVPAIGMMALGNVVIYVFGVAGLMLIVHLSFGKALALGVLPFLIGDAIKILLAAGLLPGDLEADQLAQGFLDHRPDGRSRQRFSQPRAAATRSWCPRMLPRRSPPSDRRSSPTSTASSTAPGSWSTAVSVTSACARICCAGSTSGPVTRRDRTRRGP